MGISYQLGYFMSRKFGTQQAQLGKYTYIQIYKLAKCNCTVVSSFRVKSIFENQATIKGVTGIFCKEGFY